MRDYGKVYSTFWSSQTTHSLSDDGKLLALYLMTCSHSTISGVFRLPDGYVSEDIGWDQTRVAKGFEELLANGFANRCGTTKWVWVVKHLEWNKPENPNQRKSAAKIAQSVPDQCSWKQAFMRDCAELLGIFAPEDSNPSETVKEPFLNQEQKQEQEQKKEISNLSVARPRPPDEDPEQPSATKPEKPGLPECPHQEILALWADVLPALPQHLPSLWKGARADHLRARWREKAAEKRWETQQQGLDYFRTVFVLIADSAFLSGRTATNDPARRPFQATLEWVVIPGNWAKVLEQRYNDKVAA